MPEKPEDDDLSKLSISDLAWRCLNDWKPPFYAAVPYLEAMRAMTTITDPYGADPGDMIVRYFLGNATTWRGPKARAVKAELNKRLKALGK